MASQFVRKITDTTSSEPIKETTTNGDLIITKDDKVLINLNGTLKDLTPSLTGDEFNELKSSIKKNTDGITQLNADVDSAITKAPKLDGDNTYMGINKFTDGVSLDGKNVVNGLTDTEWLDIPLEKGRTGTAKYKVSLGKVFVHIDSIRGMSGTGLSNSNSYIGKIPKGGTYYTRNSAVLGSNVAIISCSPDGQIYILDTAGEAPKTTDILHTDFVVM